MSVRVVCFTSEATGVFTVTMAIEGSDGVLRFCSGGTVVPSHAHVLTETELATWRSGEKYFLDSANVPDGHASN